jgi:hypothetical protein
MGINTQPLQSSYLTQYFTHKEITAKCDDHECSEFQLYSENKPHDNSQSAVKLQMLRDQNGIFLSEQAVIRLVTVHKALCSR